MKLYLRAALVCLLVAPATATAINLGPVPGDRIAVLDAPRERSRNDWSVATALPGYLVQELRRAGYDAYRTRSSFEQFERSGERRAADDFFVEIGYSRSDAGSYGGVGVGGWHGGAEVAVVSARLRAEIRIYSARDMHLVETLELEQSALAPTITGVGVGGRDGYFFLTLPFFERMPYRAAAKKIAREAARRLGGAADDHDDEERLDEEVEISAAESRPE